MIVTRLLVHPTSLRWRGPSTPTLGGRFELWGLEPDKEYPVHFLDAKRRLGATVNLQSGNSPTTVMLKPCGEAKARFIDEEGNPHVDYRIGLRMVITPGVFGLDSAARSRGELSADEDFIASINHSDYYWNGPRSDQEGSLILAELIPDATYRMWAFEKGKHKVLKEFRVKSGENLDLGEFTIVRKD